MDLKQLFCDKAAGVLYVGASVTAQREGFRPAFHAALEAEVGHPVTMHVNALGGVGSLFGLANVNRLRESYAAIALTVFEYSTGDLNLWITPRDLIEGVIAEFLDTLAGISPNIVVLHNYRSDFTRESGRVVREIYNAHARRHGALIVEMHRHIEDLLGARVYRLNELYRDHVHTTPQGSTVIADRLLDEISASDFERPPAPAAPVHAPIRFCNLAASAPQVDQRDALLYAGTGQVFDYLWFTQEQTLSFHIEGEVLALVLIMGPESGHLELQWDSKSMDLMAFDRNCFYHRPHCLPLRASFAQPTLVTIRNSALEVDFGVLKKTHPDTSKPRKFRLCGFVGRNLRITSTAVT